MAARLAVESDRWDAIGLPAPSADEVQMAVAMFRGAMEPAGDAALNRALMALAVLWPSAKLDPAQATAKVRLYKQALADLPADLLELAVARASRACEYQPKPAELRRLVDPELTDRRAKLHRAMLLARGR